MTAQPREHRDLTQRQVLEWAIAGTALQRPRHHPELIELSGGLDSFSDPRPRTVMKLLGEHLEAGLRTDFPALAAALDAEQLRKIGGPATFSEILDYDVADASTHAEELRSIALTEEGIRQVEGFRFRFRDDDDLVGKFEAAAAVFTELGNRAKGAERSTAPSENSWNFADLADILDGSYQPVMPTVGARDDGVGLFYPGRLNDVSGESEGGKTWLALIGCLTEITRGNSVVYLDFEDDAGGVVSRLLLLGAHRDDVLKHFHYVRPEVMPSLRDISAFLGMVGGLSPTLVVLDGVTEAMAMFGLELKENSEIAAFGQKLLRPLAATGAALVTLDHVVKNGENRGRYSLGGVHKLNGINGVKYIVEAVHPFGVGLTGRSRVRIAKDRPAQLRKHTLPGGERMHWFADLVVQSHSEDFAEGHLYPPAEKPVDPNARTAAEQKEDAEQKALRQAVLSVLSRADEPLSTTGVTDRVTGRASAVRRVLVALADEGAIRAEKGARGATLYGPRAQESGVAS